MESPSEANRNPQVQLVLNLENDCYILRFGSFVKNCQFIFMIYRSFIELTCSSNRGSVRLRASSYEPGNRAGSATGTNSVVCSYGKFQPGRPK